MGISVCGGEGQDLINMVWGEGNDKNYSNK